MEVKLDRTKFDRRMNKILKTARTLNSNPLWDEFSERVILAAKSMVPVASGTTRSSINYRFIKNGVEIFADSGYSLFIEYGTANMPAQPFLSPAFDENRARLKALIEEALNA